MISNWEKEISNQSKRDYKPGKGLQIGTEQCLIVELKRTMKILITVLLEHKF